MNNNPRVDGKAFIDGRTMGALQWPLPAAAGFFMSGAQPGLAVPMARGAAEAAPRGRAQNPATT